MWNIQNRASKVIGVFITTAGLITAAVAAMPEEFGVERSNERTKVEHYYWSHRLVGSHVLNMQGQNIGQVDALVVDGQGTLTKMLVALNEKFDTDGTPVPIAPYRAEIVSARDARVTIIRINLTRDELVRAQLAQLQSRAKPANREPAERDTGAPMLR
jgi:ribosomal 30S subunit maturation factor RimM